MSKTNKNTDQPIVKPKPSAVVLSIDLDEDLPPAYARCFISNVSLVLCRHFRLAGDEAINVIERAAAGEIVELREDLPEIAESRIFYSQEKFAQGKQVGALPSGASIHLYQRLG